MLYLILFVQVAERIDDIRRLSVARRDALMKAVDAKPVLVSDIPYPSYRTPTVLSSSIRIRLYVMSSCPLLFMFVCSFAPILSLQLDQREGREGSDRPLEESDHHSSLSQREWDEAPQHLITNTIPPFDPSDFFPFSCPIHSHLHLQHHH